MHFITYLYKMLTLKLAAMLSTVVSSQILPWIKSADFSRGLPSSIEIFTLTVVNSEYGNLTGAMAKIDLRDANLRFRVVHTNEGQKPKTPMEYSDQSPNVVYAAINGGYFNMARNFSESFIAEGGKVLYPNILNFGKETFPTVGAFGLQNRSFSAEYAYCYGNSTTGLQAYRFPKSNPFPGPQPTKSSGFKWQPEEAIGAGPILIKDSIPIKGNFQNFSEYIMDMKHPRSIICIDRQNRLLLVAIDGRYQGSNGLTIPELTDVINQLQCQDAMNLDGGGSTLLFANNRIINKPSEATGPRPVVSAVLIEDRYKKKVTKHISDFKKISVIP